MFGDPSKSPWTYLPLRQELLDIESAVLYLVLLYLAVSPEPGGPEGNRPRVGPMAMILISALVICGVLSIEWGEQRFLLASVITLGLILTRRGPVHSVCILITILLLRPWEIMETNEVMSAVPRLFAGLAISGIVVHWHRRRRVAIAWNSSLAALLALSGWLYLATYTGADTISSRRVFLELFPKYLVVFFLTINLIDDTWGVRALSGAMVIAVCGMCWVGLFRTFHLSGLEDGATRLKAVGFLEDPNDIAALAVLAFPFALSWIYRRDRRLLHFAGGIFAACTTLLLLKHAQSRGALMGLIAGGAAFALARWRPRVKGWVLVVIALLLILPAFVRFEREEGDAAESTRSRINYWISGVRMAIHHPLLGVGFNNYPLNYDAYAPEVMSEWGNRTAHSSWVLVLAEAGFPGLFLFGFFFFTVLRRAWSIREPHPEFLAATVGYGLAMSFLSHAYYIHVYILAGLVVAAERSVKPSTAVAGPETFHPQGGQVAWNQ